MIRLSRVICAIAIISSIALPAVAPPARAQQASGGQLPRAESILDKFIEVTGGRAAHEQLYNILSKGTFQVSGSRLRGAYTYYEAQPDKTRLIREIDGAGKSEEGTMAGVAWEKPAAGAPRIKEGQEKKDAFREAVFNAPLNWKKLYARVETLGVESLDGTPCYKVQLTPAEGSPVLEYYAIDSGLRLKRIATRSGQSGDIPAEVYYRDYKKSNTSVLFPFHLVLRAGSEETSVEFTSVRANVNIAANRFDLSPDIVALSKISRATAPPAPKAAVKPVPAVKTEGPAEEAPKEPPAAVAKAAVPDNTPSVRELTAPDKFSPKVAPTPVEKLAAPENLPPAAEILEKFIQVTGGRSAYERLTNILSKGTFEVRGTRMRGTYTVYESQPDKTRSILDVEGVEKIEEGTLGGVAWETSTSGGARIKEGEEKIYALREATFNSVLQWKKLYLKVESIGTEIVNGKACYKLQLTPAAGGPIIDYYDIDSGLRQKSVITLKTPGGELVTETYYSEYKESNTPVVFPFRLVHKIRNEETVVDLDSIRCNVNIAWNRFDLPPEIKTVLAKSRR